MTTFFVGLLVRARLHDVSAAIDPCELFSLNFHDTTQSPFFGRPAFAPFHVPPLAHPRRKILFCGTRHSSYTAHTPLTGEDLTDSKYYTHTHTRVST